MVLDNVPWTWTRFLVTMTPHQIQVDLGLHSILTNLAATQPAWDSSLCPTARWSKRKMYPLKCSRYTSCLNQIVIVKLICFHFLGSRSERLKLENLLKTLPLDMLSLSQLIKTLPLSQWIKTLSFLSSHFIRWEEGRAAREAAALEASKKAAAAKEAAKSK